MEHKVKGCKDCPYQYDFLCYHPSTSELKIDDKNVLDFSDVDGSPDFCPLKKEPITISIEP